MDFVDYAEFDNSQEVRTGLSLNNRGHHLTPSSGKNRPSVEAICPAVEALYIYDGTGNFILL